MSKPILFKIVVIKDSPALETPSGTKEVESPVLCFDENTDVALGKKTLAELLKYLNSK